jgi:hypothetical protein
MENDGSPCVDLSLPQQAFERVQGRGIPSVLFGMSNKRALNGAISSICFY